MKKYVKWIVLISGTFLGSYIFLSSMANIWLSATPVSNPEHYKRIGVLLFAVSIFIFTGSVVTFIVMIKKERRQQKK